MNLLSPLRPTFESLKLEIQLWRVMMRFPSLEIQRPSIWRFDSFEALEIGQNVSVGPFTEIIAYSRSPRSPVAGKLILGDRVIVTATCNLRAAGGVISIGALSGIGQGTTIVAASHSINEATIRTQWDITKTGVTIGANCWIGAGCVLMPGTSIGDGSVIAAGSVVSKPVPEHEIWGGVPARFIRKIGEAE